MFELALARDGVLEPPARDLIFEWWAGALDRQAQYGMASERKPLYQRILIKSEAELAKNDQSVSATYWLAAAARGVEDYERAWGAAIAGWVRARYMGEAGATLQKRSRSIRDARVVARARASNHTGRRRAAGVREPSGAVGRRQEEILAGSPPLTSIVASVAALSASSTANT